MQQPRREPPFQAPVKVLANGAVPLGIHHNKLQIFQFSPQLVEGTVR